MGYFLAVLATMLAFWAISVILAQFNEDYVIYWALGPLYPLLRLIFYPVRAVQRYRMSQSYYEKHGITCIQYVLGKRARDK